MQNAHDQAYGQGNGSSLSASSLGSAAALQALKTFTGGSGGGSQSALVGMAMSEASKLFDQSGGAASGGKQDAVNGAASTVMKLLVQVSPLYFQVGFACVDWSEPRLQSQMSSMLGGSNSGGLGSLAGLVSLDFSHCNDCADAVAGSFQAGKFL